MDISQRPKPPVARPREIYALWLTSFAAGPMSSVIIIFLQLLIVKQTKYLASRNDEWIEWRDKFIDGDICGPSKNRTSDKPYSRPDGMDDDCQWFPKNKEVPGVGIDYTNILVFGTGITLFLTGVSLIVLAPLGDFGRYRRQLLISSYIIWIPAFISIGFISNPSLYWLVMIMTIIGAVSYTFGLRGPFASYLPLLVESHWKLYDLKKRSHSAPSSPIDIQVTFCGRAGLVRNQHPVFKKLGSKDPLYGVQMMPIANVDDTAHTPVVFSPDHHCSYDSGVGINSTVEEEDSMNVSTEILGSGIERSDVQKKSSLVVSQEEHKQQYRQLHEAVAGQVALRESASFTTGQLIGLLLQFGAAMLTGHSDNPKNTLAERLAVVIAPVWGAIFGSIALFNLKAREGPPFPGGNKYIIGFMRSMKTLRLMHQRLPTLLSLMIGRMLLWMAIQTVLAVFAPFLEREFSLTEMALGPLLFCYFTVGALSTYATSVLVSRFSGHTLLIFKVYSILATLLPLYILIGVRDKRELYVLMVVAAALIGPFPALVRAMMAYMIPEGYTATIMSFEGVLENATTWIGPIVVGAVLEISGSMRWGIFSLLAFMICGMPFVWAVKMDVAHQQRIDFEKWNTT